MGCYNFSGIRARFQDHNKLIFLVQIAARRSARSATPPRNAERNLERVLGAIEGLTEAFRA